MGNDSPQKRRGDLVLGYLIPGVFLVLTVLDFMKDGEVAREFLIADTIFGLGLLGFRLDNILGDKTAEKVRDAVEKGSGL